MRLCSVPGHRATTAQGEVPYKLPSARLLLVEAGDTTKSCMCHASVVLALFWTRTLRTEVAQCKVYRFLGVKILKRNLFVIFFTWIDSKSRDESNEHN